jgi:hypothetical protein
MVGECYGHKISHAVIRNPMTQIDNPVHVVYLKKPKKSFLLKWKKIFLLKFT